MEKTRRLKNVRLHVMFQPFHGKILTHGSENVNKLPKHSNLQNSSKNAIILASITSRRST